MAYAINSVSLHVNSGVLVIDAQTYRTSALAHGPQHIWKPYFGANREETGGGQKSSGDVLRQMCRASMIFDYFSGLVAPA